MLLEPYYRSLGKRLVKSPKLHLTDTGLAAYLVVEMDGKLHPIECKLTARPDAERLDGVGVRLTSRSAVHLRPGHAATRGSTRT